MVGLMAFVLSGANAISLYAKHFGLAIRNNIYLDVKRI